MTTHDHRGNSFIDGISLFYLSAVALGTVAMTVHITYSYMMRMMPLWLVTALAVVLVAAIVGAGINRRWTHVGRVLCIGVAILALFAGMSWAMGIVEIPTPGAEGAPGQQVARVASDARGLIEHGGIYYVAFLFLVGAVFAWLPERHFASRS
ncbi:hypothetical protein H8Z72_22545 (plasmid) [Xanthomonas citri pv. citri]|uniref:hypothetical protein n=1 Tax=Xanthomonas citri TaxID=346 RepID=UPI00193471E3|nr:hypothetical protein [Xanthomonas citri]QRD62690.1 hypothetical protein H8Z74_23640 [Xanthomonas citri pv. citri]QRD67225.1 hypothetical protein H8Z73_22620 [Xanthomonas citri pv. citri]QRD71730.1 hypothetical protein H8Z72_22545 [Xanthomonas citri pv. citri]